MPFADGENIGPYRVLEQLGQGGMATVYKAYHAALDRYVALKVLHPAFGEDPNFEARFKREARLVAKLDHPNIVPIYDYSEHDKRPFLVMKFIEGETLKARMARGPLAADELAKIIEAVGTALAYAHKMGILHRDIKPSNVLLTTDDSVYLADFGLARIASIGESTLSGDMIMGTPQYISPEQAMGKKDLDEGTDIYSFGVMLYEMVVGQVPFNADTPFSIIHDHIYTPLPIPRAINPSVPESVERVLLKTLSKERADRYASVMDMVAAFKQAWMSAGVPMQGTTITLPPHPAPVSSPVASPSPKADSTPILPMAAAAESKTKKKRPRWTLIAGAVILFLCCLFAFIAIRRGGLFPSPAQIATRTAAAQSAPTSASQQTPLAPPEFRPASMIDDFEGAPLAGTLGWEAYFDEATASKMDCAPTTELAHSGAHSLAIQFEVPEHGWATCGFYFDTVQDWRNFQGISFLLRADRGGLPFDVAVYGGTPELRTTYLIRMETPPGSESEWMPVEIRWDKFQRAAWEDNPGMPFPPAEMTGFSIGLSDTTAETVGGTLWVDNVSLVDASAAAPSPGVQVEATLSPDILDAMRAAGQTPNDPYAQLKLALALWDAGYSRRVYGTLDAASELAGGDAAFFKMAAQEFTAREAWVAAADMYLRLIQNQGGDVSDELTELYNEALFKAAENAEFKLVLDVDELARVDEPMMLVAQARFELKVNSNMTRAREILHRAKGLKQDMPEAALFEAELFYKEGRRPEAKQILSGLRDNKDIAQWIRTMAENMLQQMP